jgi:saccharopine dehydrogenase (NAD+, L-lysine-forming)
LGLKEIPTPHEKKTIPHALQHRHVFFAHSYKYQSGWKDTLARFTSGGGEILDLEYLVYDDGKRVAAFGKEAGFAGAALSLMVWANQKINGLEHVYPAVNSYNYKSELIEEIKGLLKTVNATPSVLVIGSKGRVGTGSLECFHSVGLNDVIQWNSSDTSQPGPYLRIAQVDVCVNAILLSPHKPKNIFLDMATVERANRDQSRKLTVLGDVSCDCSNPKNPFPMSDHCTSFSDPVNRINTTGLPLDVISIDHLPTMVPREASQEFSKLLLPHLLTLKNFTFEKKNVDNENVRIWQRARDLFHAKIHE